MRGLVSKMYKGQKIACLIPARLASKRFPQKIIQKLAGKTLLQWVFEAARQCSFFDEIIFAVDDNKVFDHVVSFGARAVMTRQEHLSGTSRIIEVVLEKNMQADIFVNWQADEPFLSQKLLLDLLQGIDKEGPIWTLKHKIEDVHLLHNENIVKVVCNAQDEAMYFSRSLIPFDLQRKYSHVYKHVGLYAYTKKALCKISKLEPASCEISESLEQLRFLYHGLKIKVHTTAYDTWGIDTKEQLIAAENKMLKNCSTVS